DRRISIWAGSVRRYLSNAPGLTWHREQAGAASPSSTPRSGSSGSTSIGSWIWTTPAKRLKNGVQSNKVRPHNAIGDRTPLSSRRPPGRRILSWTGLIFGVRPKYLKLKFQDHSDGRVAPAR